MFKYDKRQQVFEFGKIKIGGQPGEYPTVCFGTMFYGRHKIVEDEDKGIFDKKAAEELWNTQLEMSDVTGVPGMNQIVGETPEAIKNYIDWFVEIDEETAFLIDSSAADVRVAAAAYCDEIGVSDRAIYNSINASASAEEIEGLKNSKIDSSIVLAFNATDPTVKGKMDVLETGAGLVEKGLLKIAEECGITRPIVDVAAMPLGVGAGASIRSVITVKASLGLPAGGGFHNTASAWDWMKKFKKQYREAYPPTDIGTNLIAQILGADFLLYGPIENARLVFPAVAMVDIMLAENAQELGLKVLEEEHPINKLI